MNIRFQRVALDEVAAGFDDVAHEGAEGFVGIVQIYVMQSALPLYTYSSNRHTSSGGYVYKVLLQQEGQTMSHYAKNIDTMDIGKDVVEEVGVWNTLRQNGNAKSLTMVLQSLPETRRDVPEGNTSFVHQFQGDDAMGKAENNGTISIKHTPSIPHEQKQRLKEATFKVLKPEIYLTKDAERQVLRDERQALNDKLQQASQVANEKVKQGGDEDAIIDSFLQEEEKILQAAAKLQYQADFITQSMEQMAIREVGNEQFAKAYEKLTSDWYTTQAQPFINILDAAGLTYKLVRNAHEGIMAIQMDESQPEFVQKLSNLMDQHKPAILETYGDKDFIITKPDGTALDKEQAAKVIAARISALQDDAKALDEAAEKYGVTRIVHSLTSPRRGYGRGMGDDVSGD